MASNVESAEPSSDPHPEFTWLERRADSILTLFTVGFSVSSGISLAFRLGWTWNIGLLAFVVGGSLVGGKYLGDFAGKKCVGGMWLPRFVRLGFLLFLLVTVPVMLSVQPYWAGFRTGTPTPTRPARGDR
jgi:hypothetical protein